MFAELPPGAHLRKHRDPYAGSLRYHLGLVTPGDDRCYIEVDGRRYSWRDGEAVVFDETFIHRAENATEHDRIILFCDIERPMKYGWATALNRFVAHPLHCGGRVAEHRSRPHGRAEPRVRRVLQGAPLRQARAQDAQEALLHAQVLADRARAARDPLALVAWRCVSR
jgi:aspartyl/asparaginyl beta-hydroxylase (cupin superfamily)